MLSKRNIAFGARRRRCAALQQEDFTLASVWRSSTMLGTDQLALGGEEEEEEEEEEEDALEL